MIFLTLLLTLAHAGPGKWTKHSSLGLSGKDYYTYVPANLRRGARPMLLALHGCTQTATDFAQTSGLNDVAEEHGFIAVYPEQDEMSNIKRCWNFFYPINQARSGEAAALADIVDGVKADLSIDADRVYVAGLSAGGAMAAIMASCYSDVFHGVAVASGLEYEAALSAPEAFYAMAHGSAQPPARAAADALSCTGAGARAQRLFAIQGLADSKVSPTNLGQVVQQFIKMGNLLNAGIAESPVSVEQGQVEGGHSYTIEKYDDSTGRAWVEKVSVDGMDHAWSGALISAPYFDQQGPNSSEMLWNFLDGDR